MRLPFISRRKSDEAMCLLVEVTRRTLNDADVALCEERAARRQAEAELAVAENAPKPVVIERTELWHLIDWSLWGSGMGDVFREQLADQFIAAITPEQHSQALKLIHAWEDNGHIPTGRRNYEDQQRRLHRALRAVARLRAEAHGQARVISRLTDQLLDATGHNGEELLPAERRVLDLDKEDA